MANIPKLKSSQVNENVSVANVMGSGEATARAIETGTKQLQGVVKTVGEIVDLKQSQEAENKARDAEFELQSYISDEGGELKEQYLQENDGKVTGFASWKARQIQDKRNTLSDSIGHRKVRDKFNDTTSYNIRKNFAYDIRSENDEIKKIAKEESDKSLALSVLKVQGLTPDISGDREHQVLQAQALKDIDGKVENGLLGELEAANMKNEVVDTLSYTRIKNQVQGGNFEAALANFKKMPFSSPQMQMRAGDMIKREELKRLKDGESALEKAVKQKKLIRDLQTLNFSEKAGAISVSSMEPDEKAEALRELEIKYPSADQARITQYKKVGAAATMGTIQDLVNGTRDPDSTTADLKVIVERLTDLQYATTDNEVAQKRLGSVIATVNDRLEKKEKRIAAKTDKEFYKRNKGFNTKLDAYEDFVKEFDYLPAEQQYEMAALEADRSFSSQSKVHPSNINSDIPLREVNLADIASKVDFNNQESIAAEKARLFKVVDKSWSNPFTWDSTKKEEVEKIFVQAEKYYKATTGYENEKARILGNADKQSKYAEE